MGIFSKKMSPKKWEIKNGTIHITQEDLLKDLGIDEKIIEAPAKMDVLRQVIENQGIDVSTIQTQEQYEQAYQTLSSNIEISQEGRKVVAMLTNEEVKNQDKFEIRDAAVQINWKPEDKRMEIEFDYLTKEKSLSEKGISISCSKGTHVATYNEQGEQRNEQAKVFNNNKRSIPGRLEDMRHATLEELKGISRIKDNEWDKQALEETPETEFNAAIQKIEERKPSREQDFRSSLQQEYHTYTDPANKLNPQVITDKNLLKKNMLEELGVNKKILNKPMLLDKLDKMVDHYISSEAFQTPEGIQGAMQTLRENVKVGENSISAETGYGKFKANEINPNRPPYAYDMTQGLAILVTPDDRFVVTESQRVRGFQNEAGDFKLKDSIQTTEYKENFDDFSQLDQIDAYEKQVAQKKEVGQPILEGQQEAYLQKTKPTMKQIEINLMNIPARRKEVEQEKQEQVIEEAKNRG